MLIQGVLHELDYVAAQQVHMPVKKRVGVALLFWLALMVWVRWNPLIIICFVLHMILLALWHGLLAPPNFKRMFRRDKVLSMPFVREVNEQGILSRNDLGESIVPWAYIRKWKYNNEVVLIYLARDVFLITPRHFFTDDKQYQAFVNLLNQKLGKAC